jgi:MFS family permease
VTAAGAAPGALTGTALEAARRRTLLVLVGGVALGSTGHIAATTVSTIAAEDLLGHVALAGAPGAAIVLGATLGFGTLTWLMLRRGRRPGLALGYALSALGGLVATLSVVWRDFPLLLLATLLIGFGNASNQLSRYTAADLVPAHRRAWSIGIVVWAATVGAVVGPATIPVAGDLADLVGLPTLAGPLLAPVVFVGAAALLTLILLRPDPYTLADTSDVPTAGGSGAPLRAILRRPMVVAAVAALVAGQFVMVLIMTMTPVHMTQHGHGLGSVGLVISGHTAGMFALSPVSGRLAQRFGSVPTVLAGAGVLAVSAVMAALAPPDGGNVLFVALFLLGFGWNLGFVAGSAMLSAGVGLADRTRVQGVADALIWSSSAVASLGSGMVLAAAGFASLGVLGLGLVGLATLVVVSRVRRAWAGGPIVR